MRREGDRPSIPVELLAQARLAARNRISLDVVLRRYFAGYSVLAYFITEEASKDGLSGPAQQRLIAVQAAAFDRLLAAVGEEHKREAETLALSTAERRRAERIERLLAGEPLETSSIAYEFKGWHLGLVAVGPAVERRLGEIAERLDRRLLCVGREEQVVWAWIGGRLPFRADDPDGLAALLDRKEPEATFAIGEPGEDLAGWRLTHRQAAAALPVAERGLHPVARYRDVALLASALQDELLVTSLRRLYLEPLEKGRDGGETAKKTLWAYLATAHNVSSTAAALGVTRNTVSKRLRAIEGAIGRSLTSCAAMLELALSTDRASPRL